MYLIGFIFLFGVQREISAQQKRTDEEKGHFLPISLPISLSVEEQRALVKGTVLTHDGKKGSEEKFRYLPTEKYFDDLREFALRDPTTTYEMLFFITEKDERRKTKIMKTVFNFSRDIAVLADIKYENIEKGHINPLFLSSKEIAGENDTTPANTLKKVGTLSSETVEDIVFVLQDMPPFGEVISRYGYVYNALFAGFQARNKTALSYWGVRAVLPEDMYTAYAVMNIEGGILVYGVGAAKVTGLAKLFKKVITNSFQSRMIGLFEWMKQEYENFMISEKEGE